jgi:hypothetical protein
MGRRSKRHRWGFQARAVVEQRERARLTEAERHATNTAYKPTGTFHQMAVATATRIRAGRQARVNAAKGWPAAPYTDPDQHTKPGQPKYEKARALAKRAARIKGLVKWQSGEPTVHYSRAGYRWVNGRYEKVNPRASGLTFRFSTNRAQARADDSAWRKEHGSRHQAKVEARQKFARLRVETNARVKQVKADEKVKRANQKRVAEQMRQLGL